MTNPPVAEAPPPPAAARRRGWLVAALVAALVAVAYQPALAVGFLSDDHLALAFAQTAPLDGSVFAVNPIRWLLFHRPLALLVWQLMYAAWGLNPLPFHLLSLALHAASSVLLVRLVGLIAPGDPRPAVAAGLAFALLPLNVEAVVWLSCWFDLLALLFSLGALICLLDALRARRLGRYALSVALFQLAIWSKETAFVLPAAALVAGLFLAPRPPARLLLASLLPYGLVIAVNLAQRYLVWGSAGGYAGAPTNVLPFVWDRLVAVLGVLLAPLNRAVIAPEVVQVVGVTTAAALLLGLIAGGQRRLALFGATWFALAIVPGFNVLTVGQDLQNARLLYPAAAGYAMVLAAALVSLTDLLRPRLRAATQLGLAAALALAAVAAIRAQVRPWVVATGATEAIIGQIMAALPPPRLGAQLQVSGIPDNYRGAYIFRVGPDPALLTRGAGLYRNWRDPAPAPIPYQDPRLDGDFFQVVLRPDERQERWEIAQARGITAPAPQPALPPDHWIYGMGGAARVERLARDTAERPALYAWGPDDCPAARGWQTQGLALECAPGVGVTLQPEGSDPAIVLPAAGLRADRWTEVVVGIEALGPASQAAAQLYWGSQASGLDEARSVTIELPETPRPLRYHFFIPPARDGAPPELLRLDPINRAVPVRITGIQLRQGP